LPAPGKLRPPRHRAGHPRRSNNCPSTAAQRDRRRSSTRDRAAGNTAVGFRRLSEKAGRAGLRQERSDTDQTPCQSVPPQVGWTSVAANLCQQSGVHPHGTFECRRWRQTLPPRSVVGIDGRKTKYTSPTPIIPSASGGRTSQDVGKARRRSSCWMRTL
jgi:hypothetical protein